MAHALHTLIRDLHRRRGRERRGLALAEGIRLVEEALAARLVIRAALASPALEATPRGQALKAALQKAGLAVEEAPDREFAELAATEHPQGVLAVVEPRRWTLDDVKPAPRAPVLVLDAVQDPGNVGTMVRTAHALGAAGVLTLPGTAELTNPKALRASMGSAFHLPCAAVDEPALRQWTERNRLRVLLASRDGVPPDRAAIPTVLVVGNEGAGIRPDFASWATGSIGIPLRHGAESLNVAIAAGILLYEVTRE
jgi:RNA methyltransferase, TrmH family